jgi:hypothetical protein
MSDPAPGCYKPLDDRQDLLTRDIVACAPWPCAIVAGSSPAR